MDQSHSNIIEIRRKHKHLTLDERGAIQVLHRQGHSLRQIAAIVGCAHTTIFNELRRGTAESTSHRGRHPIYVAKRGQKAYESHRKNSRKPYKIDDPNNDPFIQWIVEQFRIKHWSLDEAVGWAKLHNLFTAKEMVCSKTLYNMVWNGKLPISIFELPKALSHKHHNNKVRKNKRIQGRSIDERDAIVNLKQEFGHWEGDTVVGKKRGKESAVFSLLEKCSNNYIAIKIPSKTCDGVKYAMQQLRKQYGDKFSQVFKTITVDNGAEFNDFASFEKEGTKVFFAHPYSPWERPQNERHNGLLRQFLPKGESIENYTSEQILSFADEINSKPRRVLGYHTPEEIFDKFLDQVYAA